MNPGMEPALSLYRANIEACREVADIMVAGTERMEKALFKNMRDGVSQAFGAASALANPGQGAEAFKPPQIEGIVGSYREVIEAVTQTGAELVRAVTEYCAKCSRGIAEKSTASIPVSGMIASPGQHLESMLKLWNQATQQVADLAQHVAQSGSAAPAEPPARKSARPH